jgi:hypothetical protein
MTQVINSTRKKVMIGHELQSNGNIQPKILPNSWMNNYMSVPVEWSGRVWTMYFGHNWEGYGLNVTATDLFGRYGFHIYGPAIISNQIEIWNCLRVRGSAEGVRASISHLILGPHAVVTTSRMDTNQFVIARERTDIMMLKMAL